MTEKFYCLCLSIAVSTVALEQLDFHWVLAWSDEFNGESLNDGDWGVQKAEPGWHNKELQWYVDTHDEPGSNVWVDAGNLVIEARRKDGVITSGRIDTDRKKYVNPGRVEALMKLPAGKSFWPAFWLLGKDDEGVNWPGRGEIDIMENHGSDPTSTTAAVHWFDGSKTFKWGKNNLEDGKRVDEDYNLYAIEWSPDSIKWFFNDKNYFTIDAKKDAPEAPLNKEYYVLFNFAVGGTFDGDPNASTVFPDSLHVDYVRAYEWDANASEPVPQDTTPAPTSPAGNSLSSFGLADISSNGLISIREKGAHRVTISNINGKVLWTLKGEGQRGYSIPEMRLPGFSDGVYVISVVTDRGVVSQKQPLFKLSGAR